MVALNRFFSKLTWDVVGFSASAICAIHCMAVPFLLMISSLSGIEFFHNHALENFILIFSTSVGVISMIPSFRKHHQKKLPLLCFFIGLGFIVVGRFNIAIIWETIFTTAGAVSIATSHYINWKLCRPFHMEPQS